MAERAPVLSVRHITCGYRTRGPLGRKNVRTILHDVSFDVYQGEILGLVGESGTGKSTLARVILGMLEPDAGRVTHYTDYPQVVFQDPYSSLNPAYPVSWILEEPLRAGRNHERRGTAAAGAGDAHAGGAARGVPVREGL